MLSRRELLKAMGVGATLLAFPPHAEAAGRGLKFFAYDIESNDRSIPLDAALRRFAPNRFDIGVAQPWQYAHQIGRLLDANHQLVMCAYINSTHVSNRPPGSDHDIHSDWYLRDAQHRPVTALEFPENFLMNPRSGWKHYQERKAHEALVQSGYNGLYLDELGVGPVFRTNHPPIDPQTGRPWTWAHWMDQMMRLARGHRDSVGPNIKVYGNGLGNGARYFEYPRGNILTRNGGNTAPLRFPLDRALAESFLRGATQAPNYYPGRTSYLRDLAMVANAGDDALVCSKIWSTRNPDVLNRVHRWALGSFMLAMRGSGAWYFSSQNRKNTTPTPWNPLWERARSLGAPVAPRNGLHRRFEHGYVTVNNSTHDASIVHTG